MLGTRVSTRFAAVAAVAFGAASLAVSVAPAGAADTPAFVAGSAAASGSVARARLFYGGLSLPLGVGTASASYTNQQSKALGVALDVGAYVALATDVPTELQPTAIDSNSGDKQASGNLDAGEAVARVDLKATRVPASSSEIRMTDLDLPALVHLDGGHVLSTTEVRAARQRRAATVTDVAQVSIASGLVVLNDLRWEATQRSGFEPIAEASFSVGGVTVAGVPVPLPGADLNAALDPINAALLPVGLRLEAPRLARTDAGAVSIGPLRLALADSELGEQLLGPIIAGARPLLAPAFDALTDANKSLGLVGLVADIVLGVADGSGGVEVSIGGATASTSAVGFVAPVAPDAPVQSVALPDTSLRGSAPIAGLPEALGDIDVVAIDSPAIDTVESVRCALEAAPRRQGGCRDSNLPAAVGISALGIACVAAAEYAARRRRHGIAAAA